MDEGVCFSLLLMFRQVERRRGDDTVLTEGKKLVKFFVNCAVRAKKRCHLIPLDCVKPPACSIALCLSVLVSEVHGEVARSRPVFLAVCLCASTLHASTNPCYRCSAEIGDEEDKNKRRKMV